MDVFKNKNYCIDKSVFKTCHRGGVSITLPSLKKKIVYTGYWTRFARPEVESANRRITWSVIGMQVRVERDERDVTMYTYKAGNETCFRIKCLLAEVTHVILWSNRYDRVDKYLLYWIPGCRYAVHLFDCRPGLLRHDTWRCRGFFRFFMNQISLTLIPQIADIKSGYRGRESRTSRFVDQFLLKLANFTVSFAFLCLL